MSDDNGENARAYPRLEMEAYVDYTGSEVLLYHRLQNISLGGLCLQTEAMEELGTTVDLVINFPELDASISVRGEVVWANPDPPSDLGIRFVDLDSDRKETLRRYLELVEQKSRGTGTVTPPPARP